MQRNKGRKLAHLLHVDLRRISDYTESPPAFAGNHKEHDHGQGKGIQQGSEETTGKDPEGEKGRKTGQETRIGRRSDDSPLILIRRDWSASGYPNIRIPYAANLLHLELETCRHPTFNDYLKMSVAGEFA